MVTNKLKKLEAARAQIASLERAIASELRAELASLPAKSGFDSAKSFAAAVRAAAEGRRGRTRTVAKKAAGRKRRRRAVITEETRASLKKLVEAGKTGGEIARALRISLPSVQNIKKALGLVKKR